MRINSFALVVLATSAAANPHRRHVHPHPVRRDADVVTAYVEETDMAVLYVDQNGNPVATSALPVDAVTTVPTVDAAGNGSPWDRPTDGYGPDAFGPQPMPTPTSSFQDSSSELLSSPPLQTTQASPPSSETAPETLSIATPTSAAQGNDNSEGDDVQNISGYSIAYAPYNADHSCKTKDEVDADIDHLQDDNYQMVRIYGTDCDQVPNIMDAAKRNNMKVFAGIWDVNNAAAEAQLLIDGVQGDWSRIHTVSVGNEILNNGGSLYSVINGINTARTILEAAGYSGPVTTVDVYSAIMLDQNKDLCNSVDYIAANCHPFFNAEKTAEEAGSYVKGQAKRLSDWCNNTMDVMITETGWPTAGQTNGNAVPGPENQRIALQSLQDAYVDNPNALILFSAYNDLWKQDNEHTFGAEHYWGIYGTAPSAR